ncbi:MAG: FtsX-like permease family protein [Myxococcota bacterium]|nr:FtsX-like permease family protein [Myxococcota bacterium]
MLKLLRIAVRNLSRNRRRTLLAALAIMIGVGSMVVFRGFVNGMREMILSNLIDGQSGALQIHRRGYQENLEGLPLTLDFEDSPSLRQRIQAVPGVRALAPRITFGAMLSTPDQPVEGNQPSEEEQGKTTYLVATAIDPALEEAALPKRFHFLVQGHPPTSPDGPELLLNDDLFQGLALPLMADPGTRPEVSRWPALLSADRDGVLNGENVVVGGTLGSGLPGDRRVALVPLATAQRLLRMEGRVTAYAVAVDDLSRVSEVKARLEQTLGADFEVHAWNDLLPFVEQLVDLQDFFMTLVGAIFLVVVLLGILNALLMNVLERIREIGTMMAVGVRRWQILTLMVMEGAALGVMGGLGGAALGWAVCLGLSRRGVMMAAPGAVVEEVLRPYLTWGNLVAAAVISILGASLAALWPAWRASRLNPVDALRAP